MPVDITKKFKFADLTSVGSPKGDFELSKGLEDAAFNMPGGPDKINFYAQTNSDADKKAFEEAMTIYKREQVRLKKIDDAKEDIRNILKRQWRKVREVEVEKPVDLSGGGLDVDFRKKYEQLFQGNPVLQEIKVMPPAAPSSATAPAPLSPAAPPASNLNPNQHGGGLIDYIDRWNTKYSPKTYQNLESIPGTKFTPTDFIEEFDDDLEFSQKTLSVGPIDRIIFIVGTFFIRTIILFMVQWGINSHMITTFQQCFTSYVVGYVALFLVWVLIANIPENKYEENILLSSIFYYINTKNKVGYHRIIIHILLQIILLPILFIIKYYSTPIDQDSFEQRRAIYNAISNVTFFIWLMTTVVATRL